MTQITHTLILNETNDHIQYWRSLWPREVGDIITYEGNKFKVIDVYDTKELAGMTFRFLPGQRIFNHYKELFF